MLARMEEHGVMATAPKGVQDRRDLHEVGSRAGDEENEHEAIRW
jgi:hypothetical protein